VYVAPRALAVRRTYVSSFWRKTRPTSTSCIVTSSWTHRDSRSNASDSRDVPAVLRLFDALFDEGVGAELELAGDSGWATASTTAALAARGAGLAAARPLPGDLDERPPLREADLDLDLDLELFGAFAGGNCFVAHVQCAASQRLHVGHFFRRHCMHCNAGQWAM
jgi:hypothetical protein